MNHKVKNPGGNATRQPTLRGMRFCSCVARSASSFSRHVSLQATSPCCSCASHQSAHFSLECLSPAATATPKLPHSFNDCDFVRFVSPRLTACPFLHASASVLTTTLSKLSFCYFSESPIARTTSNVASLNLRVAGSCALCARTGSPCCQAHILELPESTAQGVLAPYPRILQLLSSDEPHCPNTLDMADGRGQQQCLTLNLRI